MYVCSNDLGIVRALCGGNLSTTAVDSFSKLFSKIVNGIVKLSRLNKFSSLYFDAVVFRGDLFLINYQTINHKTIISIKLSTN